MALDLKVPEGKTLMPFQVEAVERSLQFLTNGPEKACYNACEMGLGKSIQSVVVANTLSCARVLIICPAIMRLTWLDEFRAWTTRKNTRYCVCLDSSYIRDTKDADVVILSYDIAARYNSAAFLASQRWSLLIADEFHYCKNPAAKRTQAVCATIWPSTTYRLGLSGTPCTNNVTDMFVALHKMLPLDFPNFRAFASRYSFERHTPWGIQRFGIKNAEELRATIREKCFIRYTKAEVLDDLPPKVYQRITIPERYSLKLAKTDAEKLAEQTAILLRALDEGGKIPVIPSSLAGQRRMQGLLKVDPVCEFTEELLEQGIPIVLFAYHKEVIARIAEKLSKYRPVIITGDTPPAQRHAAVKKFQDGETDLFIGNLIAAGTGVTLTRSSTVVLAEITYVPSDIEQACARVHRISQNDSVTIFYFLVDKSVDGELVEAVIQKARDFAEVIEN